MNTTKQPEKIFGQLERFEQQINKLQRQLALFAVQSISDDFAAYQLQRKLEHVKTLLAVFRQQVLYGYGKPRPSAKMRAKYPNTPEVLE